MTRILPTVDGFKVDDHVVYIFSGPERTGVIRYLDESLASVIDDEIKMSVSIRRSNLRHMYSSLWNFNPFLYRKYAARKLNEFIVDQIEQEEDEDE